MQQLIDLSLETPTPLPIMAKGLPNGENGYPFDFKEDVVLPTQYD
jgi:hypothetical protein